MTNHENRNNYFSDFIKNECVTKEENKKDIKKKTNKENNLAKINEERLKNKNEIRLNKKQIYENQKAKEKANLDI